MLTQEIEEATIVHDKTIEVTFKINIVLDFKFWAILPALNINLHYPSIEFEWLCLGIYIEKVVI